MSHRRSSRTYPSLAPRAARYWIKVYFRDQQESDPQQLEEVKEYLLQRKATPNLYRDTSTGQLALFVCVSEQGWINLRKFVSDQRGGLATTHVSQNPLERPFAGQFP